MDHGITSTTLPDHCTLVTLQYCNVKVTQSNKKLWCFVLLQILSFDCMLYINPAYSQWDYSLSHNHALYSTSRCTHQCLGYILLALIRPSGLGLYTDKSTLTSFSVSHQRCLVDFCCIPLHSSTLQFKRSGSGDFFMFL